MKVAFLLPHGALYPIGGFKMVFEYANRLAANSWDVTIVYSSTMQKKLGMRDYLRYYVRKFTKGYKPNWYKLDSKIHQKWVTDLEHYHYDKDSIVVGTFITTVLVLNKYDLPACQKVYFIQGYDIGAYGYDSLITAYHFHIKKIVISQWLKDILDSLHEKSYLVPNGFASNSFMRTIPIENRRKESIIFMYHISPDKGVDLAFRAIEIVKKHIPTLKVTLFSVFNKPEKIPDNYQFYKSPDKDTFVRIYNEASIYVGSSRTEGWGLTVGEAMMCGCAVACTNNKGYLEMAKDGVNALVSPVDDAEALATNIIKLIKDDHLRYKIANTGYKMIQEFSIEKSFEKFEEALKDQVSI